MPTGKAAGRPGVKYPFASLNVCDASITECFLVPVGTQVEKTVADRIRLHAGRWRKETGNTTFKFTVAPTLAADGTAVIGVWRTA